MVSIFFGLFAVGRSVGSLVTGQIYAVDGITSTLLFSAGLTLIATLLFLVSVTGIEPHRRVRLVPCACTGAASRSADTQSVELTVVRGNESA